MANSKIILGYWNIRGFAQPIRFMAKYLGVELSEKIYTYKNMDEWRAGDKLTLGLDFPNVPYLINDKVKLTETRAIISYFAREYGMGKVFPSKNEDYGTCAMLENVLWDVWLPFLLYCDSASDSLKQSFENDTPTRLKRIEEYLGNKNFLLGDQISYVDFIMYEMIYQITVFQADYFEKYPIFLKFKKRFEEIPAIAEYIASSESMKWSCINPFAKIKI